MSNGDTAEIPRSSSFSASDCLYDESPVHSTSTFTFVSTNSAVLLRRLRVAIFTCLLKTVITDLLMLSDAEYPPLHLTTLIKHYTTLLYRRYSSVRRAVYRLRAAAARSCSCAANSFVCVWVTVFVFTQHRARQPRAAVDRRCSSVLARSP